MRSRRKLEVGALDILESRFVACIVLLLSCCVHFLLRLTAVIDSKGNTQMIEYSKRKFCSVRQRIQSGIGMRDEGGVVMYESTRATR